MDTNTTQSSKRGFGLRSLFVREDVPTSATAAPSAAPATTPGTTATFTPLTPGPLYQSPLPTSTSVDPEVRDVLLQSLQDNKLAGYDYLKFVAALEEMKTCGGNEEARFKMAYIAAKQLGVDKAKLIQTAQHYQQVLQSDAQQFNNDLAAKQNETVTANENHIKEIDASIANCNQQIQQLTAQITQLQQEKTTLAGQVMENKTKLEVRKRSFEVTYQALVAEIDANIQKINQYIV